MKILITAATFSTHISGVQRHAFNLVRCLLLSPEIERVHLALAPWQREMAESMGLRSTSRFSIHYEEMARDTIARNLWYYRELPKLVSRLQPDLLHLSYPMPVNAGAIACPIVLTLHDLYPYEIPKNFGRFKSLFNRAILKHCLQRVDAIACVSEATVTALRRHTSSALQRKATRIFNCVEPAALSMTPSPFPGADDKPFFLTVAQHRRNKNIPLLIRVFDRLLREAAIRHGTRLLVVGIKGPESRLIQSTVSQLGLERSVLFLEGLSEDELQWCYTRSEAIILPSTTEGFGLPVAEALLAGCRVVCSDIPAFREVGGDHCTFVTLGAQGEENLARGIKDALQKPDKGRIALPHLSAHALTHEYERLYRRFITAASSAQNTVCPAPMHPVAAERQSL